MKELFSYTKLFTILLSIFYISGLVGYFFEIEILILIVVFVILCVLIWFLNLDFKKVLILFFVFSFGLLRAHQSSKLPDIIGDVVSNNTMFFGKIISSKDISAKNNKIKFYISAQSAKISDKNYENLNTKILISMPNDASNEFVIGDKVKIKGKLRHPKSPTNPYQFDYKRYLLNNGVKDIVYAETLEKIGEIKFNEDKWLYTLRKFEKIRNDILEKHSKYVKSPRLEILGGIVFGSETIKPDEEIKENFKNSGLLHLLAASGLNVALIYGIWYWIASLIRFPYNLSILIGAVLVVFYTFMTGFPPSILRASIMLLFVLFGKIVDRNANSLALIFFVGLLMLLFSPKMLFDVGFQLSFVVTIGLVVCVPVVVEKFDKLDKKYKEKYKKSSRIKKYFSSLFSPTALVGVVSIPLVAQFFVIPLQMHYFNSFTPFSLLANIAVVPFIGILSFIGFVSSIFSFVPILNEPIIQIFDSIANPLLALLIKISEFFSSFKFSLFTTMGLNLFQIFLFWSIGLIATLNLKNNFKNKKQSIVLLSCLLIFFASFIQFKDNHLEIMMFDVENADSFLIKTPKNNYILIDTGKKSYRGISDAQMVINKYLKNERIPKIKTLIITHFDADHCAGAVDILKENKVEEIIIKNENSKSQISKELIEYLKEKKLNYKTAKNNETIYDEDNLKIKTFTFDFNNDNESSIITLLNYKDKNLLFMGDSGVLGYENIKNYLPNKIEIIKIGHHGAKNSINNEMIKNLKPNYALISVGFNKFNHPHYSTIETLKENDVQIISTKNLGFSKFDVDANKIQYFDGNKKTLKNLQINKNEEQDFFNSKYIEEFISKNRN